MRNSQTYQNLLNDLSKKLKTLSDKPEENTISTLDALWHVTANNPTVIEKATKLPLKELSKKELNTLSNLIETRLSGIPLAHLIGKERFMDIDFIVSPKALVPRKETELLGKSALKIIKEKAKNQSTVKIIDVCTGMGNLALSFAYHEPKAKVFAADLSVDSINLAKENLKNLKLRPRVDFYIGDLLEPFKSNEYYNEIDILTCNPPYISSKRLEEMPEEIIKYEPELAFNGGPFGIKILNRLFKEAIPFIKDGGWLCFEVGAGQGPGLKKMLGRNNSFSKILTIKDKNNEIRAINAQILK